MIVSIINSIEVSIKMGIAIFIMFYLIGIIIKKFYVIYPGLILALFTFYLSLYVQFLYIFEPGMTAAIFLFIATIILVCISSIYPFKKATLIEEIKA